MGQQRNSNRQERSVTDEMPIIPWYKTLKIWIQSFLGGVGNILIGFRNERGVVVDIKTLPLQWFEHKMHYFDKRTRQTVFKGNVCLNFTDTVLSFIKKHCTTEDVVYRVVFNQPWDKLVLYAREH